MYLVTLEDMVIRQGIACDAAYASHMVADIQAIGQWPLAFCISPYLSLFVHESFAKLKATEPALAATLSTDVEQIVARSRHSLKLFDDTKRGIPGQLTYFRDELLPAHRARFIDRIAWPLRFLGKDLGLFAYRGRLITTTHSATFHIGLDPEALLAIDGPELRLIYEQYGWYFGHLGGRLEPGSTFLSQFDPRHFSQQADDVRAETYYRRVFDGPGNPDLNALLTVFQTMMDFIDVAELATCTPADYTPFKIRFLTLYQVLSSLRRLRDQQSQTLTARSVNFLETLTSSSQAQAILDPATKPFRNTLMHYNLSRSVDMSAIDLSAPLFGLVPVYFPGSDADALGRTIGRCVSDTAMTLDAWASGK
jgi:hypothetical protein